MLFYFLLENICTKTHKIPTVQILCSQNCALIPRLPNVPQLGKSVNIFQKLPPFLPRCIMCSVEGCSQEREGGGLQGPGTQRKTEGDLELRQQFPATANIIFPSQALTKVTHFCEAILDR